LPREKEQIISNKNEISNLHNRFLDNIPYFIMFIDAENFKVLYLNKSMAKSLGKKKEELIGKNILNFLPKKSSIIRKKYAEKVIKTKKPQIFEDEREGRYFLNHFYPIINEKGIVSHGMVFVEDITEKKKIKISLEKKDLRLKDANIKYKLLTDRIVDVILQVSLTGKILYISPSCERISGYIPEEVIGKRFTLFAPKKEWPKYLLKLNEIINSEIVNPFTTYIKHKNGNNIPVEFSGYKEKGNKKYFNAVMRDISERERIDSRYKLLLEKSGIPITFLDLKGDILLINELGAKNLGGTPKNFIGKSIYKLIPDFANEQKKRIKIILDTKKGLFYEDKIKLKSGYRWFISNLQPITDENNKIIGIQISSVDITDQHRSEEKYINLFQNSNDAIFTHDLKGNIFDVNDKAITLFGYTNEEFLSLNISNLHPSNELEKSKFAFEKIIKNGSVKFEINFKKKNGDIFTAEVSSSLYDVDDKKIIQGIVRDITKRKKADLIIKETRDHLQKVLDNTSELIFSIDKDFKIQTWNKTGLKIIGYDKNKIIGKNINELNIFENKINIIEYIKNIFQGEIDNLAEITIKTISGMKHVFSISQSNIKDNTGKLNEILFVCRDITKEKDIHEKLKFGHSYIIFDKSINNSIDLFTSLIDTGIYGVFIGRNIEESIKKLDKSNLEIIQLSLDNSNEENSINKHEDLINITNKIIRKNNKSIILIDRIDYLITKFSFEIIMKILYELNDIIRNYETILLLRINPSIISQKQISILSEEFNKLPSQKITDIRLDEGLLNILNFINLENNRNLLINYTKIGKKFSISKITAKKRIELLISKDLIYSKEKGKTKYLYMTDKGKNIINKNLII
jgi:PAS domain S-box-containing protein